MHSPNRLLIGSALLCALLFPAHPDPAGAALGEIEGRRIMERVDRRPRGADQVLQATWRLVLPSGRERIRKTRSYWRDYREASQALRSKRLIVFDSPADLRDMAFLVWSYVNPDADDDRWIYLPSLRKVRRVAGRDRGKAFAGTEFNYEDLADREIDEDVHRLVRTAELEGAPVHVVESIARDTDSPYSKRVHFVDTDAYTLSRIEYYDRHGRLSKVLDIDWQLVDGIWLFRTLDMRNVRSGHRTIVQIDQIKHDVGLGDDAFTESGLRFGVP